MKSSFELSEHKFLKNLGALTNMVRRVAIEAGEITLKYFDDIESADLISKTDGSPVSLADKEAEIYIQRALSEILPDIPMVGEEAAEEGKRPDLSQGEYFWLVDPLDGTREFIRGGKDFTVNIALICGKDPILGVVHAPAREEIYAGYIGANGQAKAIKFHAETQKDKEISVRPYPKEGLIVAASASHGNEERLQKFIDQFKVQKVIKRGSSLKICAIAEGKADLYPRFGPTSQWDTAAGHAILKAAGGVLTDLEGRELKYGDCHEKYLNPEFVACSFSWFNVED